MHARGRYTWVEWRRAAHGEERRPRRVNERRLVGVGPARNASRSHSFLRRQLRFAPSPSAFQERELRQVGRQYVGMQMPVDTSIVRAETHRCPPTTYDCNKYNLPSYTSRPVSFIHVIHVHNGGKHPPPQLRDRSPSPYRLCPRFHTSPSQHSLPTPAMVSHAPGANANPLHRQQIPHPTQQALDPVSKMVEAVRTHLYPLVRHHPDRHNIRSGHSS
ncbi:hypothetical protein M8818_003385 [Zalaria obscura]|uniref:Uncharacterized protein n=1 Tax=Zalaria obscura TaxID=2024903 RepID=A0ACC3SEZ1_9PEZI